VVTVPEEKKPTVTEAPPSPPPPRPAPRHRKKQSEGTQTAENTPPPEVSAAGQLSTGDSSDQGQQTSNSLADTEHKLNTLGRKLNDQEQKTSAQIREFVKEARAALNTGDVEGAKTLAQKAKVLLGELTK
jgi:ribosomal protein S20